MLLLGSSSRITPLLTVSSQKIAITITSTLLTQQSLIAATISPKSGRFEECGAETFNQGRHLDCGVEIYQLQASNNCPPIYDRRPDFGAETFNTGEGDVCGPELYAEGARYDICGTIDELFWSGWAFSPSCPGPRGPGPLGVHVAQGSQSAREMRLKATFFGPKPEFRIRCIKIFENRCRDAAFGVEKWKQCRHEVFGVELYKQGIVGYTECRSDQHPAEQYKVCAHPSFGAAIYKECSLYKTNQELGQYLEDVKTFMPIHANAMYANSGTFLEMLGSKSSLGCLIKNAESDPLTQTMADKLKETFSRLTGRSYTSDDGIICDGIKPFNELEQFSCDEKPDSPMCKAKASYMESKNILTESSENLRILLGDIVATSNTSTLNKISNQIEEIEKLLEGK